MTDQELAAEAAELRKQFADWSGMGVEPGHLAAVVMNALRHGAERAERVETECYAVTRERDEVKARRWIQCTSASNECLGGCRSMVEHDRYAHRQLLDDKLEAEAIGERLTRERDEARADAARLREALESMLAHHDRYFRDGRDPLWTEADDGRVRAALASTPSPEGPDYSGLCSAPECGGHCGYAHARGCEAIREYLAEHGGAPYRAPSHIPSAEPSARDMRVAEAVLLASAELFALHAEQAANDVRNSIDLAAVVKAVSP